MLGYDVFLYKYKFLIYYYQVVTDSKSDLKCNIFFTYLPTIFVYFFNQFDTLSF